MPDLHHSVPINAASPAVYAAIATQAGMQGWWTKDTMMNPVVGEAAYFGFDKRGMVFHMTILELAPGRGVKMRCTGDQPEWAGTTLEWTIEPGESGSILRFVHHDWREMTDFCASCNSMWGQLMFRLKAFVESGTPNPQWME